MKKELKRLNVRIGDEMYNWLKDKSEELNISINSLVILAINNYIREETVIPNIPKMLEKLDK